MRPVAVRIFHPEPRPEAGPLERWVAAARLTLAERNATGFIDAGAGDTRIVRGPPDHTPFGRRLRDLVRAERPDGLVVLGSGAVPLATPADRRAFVAAAGADGRRALVNNRFSADIVAVSDATAGLRDLPDLPGDNALARWLATDAGYAVGDLRRRWRLGVDVDGPMDLVLLDARRDGDAAAEAGIDLRPVTDRIADLRSVAADPGAELLVAGRTSAVTLAWLERSTASRTRALIEERGMRTAVPGQRPASSVLGALLDQNGPTALGAIVARLGGGAVIDTRVLLAHRLGADERAWPVAEDRFASDLLLPDRIADPWLRELTMSAADATIPVLLGGHTLVGPGLRRLIRSPVASTR